MKHFQIEFKHGAMVYEILSEKLFEEATGDDESSSFQRLISDDSGFGQVEKGSYWSYSYTLIGIYEYVSSEISQT